MKLKFFLLFGLFVGPWEIRVSELI